MKKLLGLFCACALAGCGPTGLVHDLNPAPNIALNELSHKLKLEFSPSIQDDYIIPASTFKEIGVKGWKQSLNAAFNNGLSEYQSRNPNAPAYTLLLKKADMTFIPAAVRGDGVPMAAKAQIDYQAELLDNTGKSLGRTASTVISNVAWSTRNGENRSAADAVKMMFEEISNSFFKPSK